MKFILALALFAHIILAIPRCPDSQEIFSTEQLSLTDDLPVVDLGYAKYRATEYDSEEKFYRFNNIRYARPPTGRRRFALPEAPSEKDFEEDKTETGSYGHSCHQAIPDWIPASVLGLNTTNDHEDCLFLNVNVPEGAKAGDKLPVLIWIYGGGYVFGDKDTLYDPAGLMRSGKDKLIFVAMNYRMGAFGFLNGPSYIQSSSKGRSGTANLGFHDQRAAMMWVQDYIERFGGDPKSVTVMGESAGAGSITHHLTAYAGMLKPLFHRAIIQSPAWVPSASHSVLEQQFQNFLVLANASDLESLRKVSQETLVEANKLAIADAPYGTFNFGPSIDGTFVPDLPQILMSTDHVAEKVDVIVGHQGKEGNIFTDLRINWILPTQPGKYLRSILPLATDYFIEDLEEFYPRPSGPANDDNSVKAWKRAARLIADGIVTCHTRFIAEALGKRSYNYVNNLGKARHGDDVPYTFRYKHTTVPGGPFDRKPIEMNLPLAEQWQGFITNFTVNGKPNAEGLRHWPRYGSNRTVMAFNDNGIELMTDVNDNARCDYWRKSLYI